MHHDGKKIKTEEKSRTYYYINETTGTTVSFKVENVVEVVVSESQHHYLTTSSGDKFIMKPCWFCIQIHGNWATKDQVSSN